MVAGNSLNSGTVGSVVESLYQTRVFPASSPFVPRRTLKMEDFPPCCLLQTLLFKKLRRSAKSSRSAICSEICWVNSAMVCLGKDFGAVALIVSCGNEPSAFPVRGQDYCCFVLGSGASPLLAGGPPASLLGAKPERGGG